MDEQEKRELIQAINEIRKELNLEPYPLEYLEAKDMEELRKLYSTYFKMREDYRKKLKEEKRFKLNLKTGLIIGIPVILIVSFLLFIQFISKPPKASKETLLPFFPSPREVKKPEVLNFTVWFAGYQNNQSIFMLHNQGINISTFKIRLDGNLVEAHIISGKLPLGLNEEIIFSIKNFYCDNQRHNLTVIVEDKEQSIEFANLCIAYG